MAIPLIAAGAGIYQFLTGAGLLAAFRMFTIFMVAKLIFVFGVGFIIYTGIDSYMAYATALIDSYSQGSNVSGFPEAVQILRIMRLPDGINLIMSSYLAIISYKISRGLYKQLTFGLG